VNPTEVQYLSVRCSERLTANDIVASAPSATAYRLIRPQLRSLLSARRYEAEDSCFSRRSLSCRLVTNGTAAKITAAGIAPAVGKPTTCPAAMTPPPRSVLVAADVSIRTLKISRTDFIPKRLSAMCKSRTAGPVSVSYRRVSLRPTSSAFSI
jgi:hypothetical protein